jgi:hypothetical protein
MSYLLVKIVNDKSHHFWHFMMGEFIPLCYLFSTKPKDTKWILFHPTRNWGGGIFDSFYKELSTNGVNIKLVNKQTEKFVSHVGFHEEWDFTWGDGGMERCKQGVQFIKKLSTDGIAVDITATPSRGWLCQYRGLNKKIKEYFMNANVGSRTYGTDKRQFFDVMDIHLHVSEDIYYRYSDDKSLFEQIREYTQGHVNIILEHGAGMVMILFMTWGEGSVLELITPRKFKSINGAEQGCVRICQLVDKKLHRVVIENKQSVLPKINEIKCIVDST